MKRNEIDIILDKAGDPIIKNKVLGFWDNDLNKYILGVSKLSTEIDNEKISSKEAKEIFFQLTDEIMQKADALSKAVNSKIVLKSVKQGFRESVGAWIYKGIIVKMAMEKPRGYPGDYKILEDIYNNQSISEGIGYYSDNYFLENEYAVAVRNRKDKMKEMLRDFIRNSNSSKIRVLNLACGSCREIKELFIDNEFTPDKEIIFTLLDQDEGALEFSRNTLKKLSPNIKLNFLKADILRLTGDNNLKKMLQDQDLIYSIGLADYFPDRVLRSLSQYCIELLGPEGKFIITHKDSERCMSAPPDWFCDWCFYPRKESELVNLLRSITTRNFNIEAGVREKSNRIFFVTIDTA